MTAALLDEFMNPPHWRSAADLQFQTLEFSRNDKCPGGGTFGQVAVIRGVAGPPGRYQVSPRQDSRAEGSEAVAWQELRVGGTLF